MHETRAEIIRRLIQQTFHELGSRSAAPLRETLLIREGTYCGHRFERDQMSAVWFIEENQLKFYDSSGGVVKAIQPFDQEHHRQQKAA